jgi:diguanylate cyclase (GGDEF)-like protein
MERFSFGLRARLLLLVLFAIIPAFGLIGYTAFTQFERNSEHVNEDSMTLVRLTAREQERLIADANHLLIALSEVPELRTRRTAAACSQLLARLHKSFMVYTNIGVADLKGDIFCNSRPMPGPINIVDRSYYRRAILLKGFGVGDYQIGRVTGKPAINFGYPVRDADGRIVAVVYVALDLGWLESLVRAAKLPAGSVLTVMDSHGTILARYPDSEKWMGRSMPESPLLRTILASKSAGTMKERDADDQTRLFAFATLQEQAHVNVYVIAGIPENVAFAETYDDLRRNLTLLLIVGVLALIGAWAGGNVFIVRRANALDAAAQRLAKGDLSARTGLTYSNEELGRVARSFDIMAASLQRVNRTLKTLSAGNRALVRATDEPSLLMEMCRILVEVGGFRFAWIGYAQDDEQKTVRVMAQHGFPGGLDTLRTEIGVVRWADAERGRGPAATAIRTGTISAARNILIDPGLAPWRETAARQGYAASVALPLRVQEKTIGAISIYSSEAAAFDDEELQLLSETADDLAFGITTLRTRLAHDWAHATLADIARYDKLTGLPNHAHFEEQLHQTLAEGSLAVLVIGFTRLNDINTALGFTQGDTLLTEASARLRRVLKPNTLLARMRGKEFAVLLPRHSAEQTLGVARSILDALRAPFTIGGLKLEVDAVIGISRAPEDGADTASLLRHADVALQQARKSEKDLLFFQIEFESGSKRRLELAAELRHAIESNELILHYQPKLEMRNGRLCGAEALVRWQHPTRGLIPPNDFIALAEQTGLIKALTEWVLETALRQCALWHREGLAVPVAINLSARNLHEPTLVEKIQALLTTLDAQANWLEIEITESAIMDDPESALATLTRLSDMGIALSIDDFGTGYSSLGYLKKLPVDAVKIDKSFVQDMLTDSDSAAIVRSTINLAHELDMKVVAEGIEKQAVWVQLTTLHCDIAQGYHISKPLPADTFTAWCHTRAGKAAGA